MTRVREGTAVPAATAVLLCRPSLRFARARGCALRPRRLWRRLRTAAVGGLACLYAIRTHFEPIQNGTRMVAVLTGEEGKKGPSNCTRPQAALGRFHSHGRARSDHPVPRLRRRSTRREGVEPF